MKRRTVLLLAALLCLAAAPAEAGGPSIPYDVSYADDSDGDGVTDRTTYYQDSVFLGETLTGAAWDTTGDGSDDLWFRVSADWRVDMRMADRDGDGVPDEAVAVNDAGLVTVLAADQLGAPIDGSRSGSALPIVLMVGGAALLVAVAAVAVRRGRKGRAAMTLMVVIGLFGIAAQPATPDLFDEDCNLNEEVFDSEWERYSDFDARVESPSFEVQEFTAVAGVMQQILEEGFQLEVDQEFERQTLDYLREYRSQLLTVKKANLARAYIRMVFLTFETIYSTTRLSGSVSKLLNPETGVQLVGAITKITDRYRPSLPGKKQQVSDSVKGVGWGVFKEALESNGDPKSIVASVATSSIGEADKLMGSWTLSADEIEILRTQHLESRLLDDVMLNIERTIASRDSRLTDIDIELEILDEQLDGWRAAEKERVRALLVAECERADTTVDPTLPPTTATTPTSAPPADDPVGLAVGTYEIYEPSVRVTIEPYTPVAVEREDGAITIRRNGRVRGGFNLVWSALLGDDPVRIAASGTIDRADLIVSETGLTFVTVLHIEETFDDGEEPLTFAADLPATGWVDLADGRIDLTAVADDGSTVTIQFHR